MTGRSFATFGWLALSVVWLLTGCAGNQTLSEGGDSGNRQQLVIAGAKRSDVKGLAMGAARAKGWSIVKSTDDLLVMQRPLDPAAPATAALGVTNSSVPPVIEVTSNFREESGGTNVSLGAVLITQPPGASTPKRTDYTVQYRDALNQSLQSLRANWTANRQRVANAIPPLAGNPEPAPANGASAAGSARPATQAWGEPAAEAPTTRPNPPAPPPAAPTPEPLARPTAPEATQESAVMPPLSQSRSALPTANLALAPVVDGSSTLAGRSPAPIDGSDQRPEPVEPPQNTMLALNQGGGTGAWAYYAEQYARLRGCKVASGGTQLIESRSDGEIHKVSCVGSASYLLKCESGVCRELAPVQRAPAAPQTRAGAKADPTAAKPEPKTAKTGSRAEKPEGKTAKADAKPAKPGPKTAKADAKAAKPARKTTKTDAKAAKPAPKTTKTDAKAAKPDPKTAKADAKAAKPAPKTTKADAKAAKTTTKADLKGAKPKAKSAKDEKSAGRPSNSKSHVAKAH